MAKRRKAAPRRPRVGFVQIGSRLHYAVPLALQRAGLLHRMYVDWYAGRDSLEERVAGAVSLAHPSLGRKLLHRRCAGLDDARVERRAVLAQLLLQALARGAFGGRWDRFLWAMRTVATAHLRKGFGDANVLMGFVRESHPCLFEAAKRRGLVTVGDQIIAPAAVELRELREQFRRWPDWQKAEGPGSTDHLLRMAELERQTWGALDHVTCASEYVQKGLVGQGVDEHKVSVLSYPVDTTHYPFFDRAARGNTGPVTVGFVGHVHLRKGVPYFIEVAKRLKGRGIRFVMVGGVCLEPAVVAAHRDVVECVGAVPRPEVAGWLGRFDLLLFPSTCEGSASAVAEAMATGLPVVCSPNSGSVVRHGTDGFVLPYDQSGAMAAAVERLASNPSLRLEMGRAAAGRIAQFTVDGYGRGLTAVLARLMAERVGAIGQRHRHRKRSSSSMLRAEVSHGRRESGILTYPPTGRGPDLRR